MKVFFFGCHSPEKLGHHLYDSDMRLLWGSQDKCLPFKFDILDGSLLPPNNPQVQGRPHLSVINGWTILGMWDRTGDSRFGSNSSFIAEGIHSEQQMVAIAKQAFPKVWSRIMPD